MSANVTKTRQSQALVITLIIATTSIAAHAQTFTTLVMFGGAKGASPQGPPVQGIDGNFYGTTFDQGPDGFGTLYQMTPQGQVKTMYSFCCNNDPGAGLTLSPNGTLYGVATGFLGSIFQFTTAGALTTLVSFDGTDGTGPLGGLIQGVNGHYFGTTASGGANATCPGSIYGSGCGTVFEMHPSGFLTTIYNFSGADGDYPAAALVLAADGDLYGTTASGGANNNCVLNGSFGAGCGTVFKMTPSGELTTLYSFSGTDGAYPIALVQGPGENFYGATAGGGANSACSGGPSGPGCGTIFNITRAGALTTLYNFCARPGCADGATPGGAPPFTGPGLIRGTDGKFCGTTVFGGANGDGTIFNITFDGTLTTLHSFDGTDGSTPYGGLVQGTDGSFYGTTSMVHGTIFNLSMGLGPFVRTLPGFGQVGSPVTILGTDLTGPVSVAFDGTPAAITFFSSAEIRTTVPAGARTGTVQVTTPAGIVSSKVPFKVLQ